MSFLSTVLAQGDTIKIQENLGEGFNRIGGLTVPDVVSGFIRLALVIAAIVFFFILVIGGIRWIMSGGDKAQTENARNQITAALVGVGIVFAAWAIVALINTFFRVNIFELKLPSAFGQ